MPGVDGPAAEPSTGSAGPPSAARSAAERGTAPWNPRSAAGAAAAGAAASTPTAISSSEGGPRSELPRTDRAGGAGARRAAVHAEEIEVAASKPRFLDTVRATLRARHYSRRTEEAYVQWIRRFIISRGKRLPADMGAGEVSRFLTWLAVARQVAASTQNQALRALLFLYRTVLGVDLPWLDDVVRARRHERPRIVLTRDEVRLVLDGLSGTPRPMAYLLYGSGLRLLECCRLRVQDVDFDANQTRRSGIPSRKRTSLSR